MCVFFYNKIAYDRKGPPPPSFSRIKVSFLGIRPGERAGHRAKVRPEISDALCRRSTGTSWSAGTPAIQESPGTCLPQVRKTISGRDARPRKCTT